MPLVQLLNITAGAASALTISDNECDPQLVPHLKGDPLDKVQRTILSTTIRFELI